MKPRDADEYCNVVNLIPIRVHYDARGCIGSQCSQFEVLQEGRPMGRGRLRGKCENRGGFNTRKWYEGYWQIHSVSRKNEWNFFNEFSSFKTEIHKTRRLKRLYERMDEVSKSLERTTKNICKFEISDKDSLDSRKRNSTLSDNQSFVIPPTLLYLLWTNAWIF